jgi:1-acyl-sn-glycerol-3-phosphate acyltransferase
LGDIIQKIPGAVRLILFFGLSPFLLGLTMIAVVVSPGTDLYYRVGVYWVHFSLRVFGARLVVRGAENLDPNNDYVFLANHRSMLDPPAIIEAVVPRVTRWVAKAELRKIPVFGRTLAMTGQIFIDRSDTQKAVNELQRRTDDRGAIVIFFPEGQRSPGRGLLPFKKGGAAFAIQASMPIVPVAVSGSERCLPAHTVWSRPGTITVEFGEPIETSGLGMDQCLPVLESTRMQMSTMLERLEGPLPSSTAPVETEKVEPLNV